MPTAYVYLAPTPARDRFKVGWAVDPRERLRNLRDGIHLSGTWVIQCGDLSQARAIERTLHAQFDLHRVSPGHTNEGYTEWFQYSSLSPMLSYVRANQGPLGHLGVYTFTSAPFPPPLSVSVTFRVPEWIVREADSHAWGLISRNQILRALLYLGVHSLKENPSLLDGALGEMFPVQRSSYRWKDSPPPTSTEVAKEEPKDEWVEFLKGLDLE
jgi:hypothetical protein